MFRGIARCTTCACARGGFGGALDRKVLAERGEAREGGGGEVGEAAVDRVDLEHRLLRVVHPDLAAVGVEDGRLGGLGVPPDDVALHPDAARRNQRLFQQGRVLFLAETAGEVGDGRGAAVDVVEGGGELAVFGGRLPRGGFLGTRFVAARNDRRSQG